MTDNKPLEHKEFTIDDGIPYRIYRSWRLIRFMFFKIAQHNGMDVTPEQLFVLVKLAEREGQSQVELGDSVFNDRPNMKRILDSMEEKQYVERRPHPVDKRKHCVFTTEKGKQLLTEAIPHVLHTRDQIYEGLSNDDVVHALKVLDVIESNIMKKFFD